jgi:hypothetical protein
MFPPHVILNLMKMKMRVIICKFVLPFFRRGLRIVNSRALVVIMCMKSAFYMISIQIGR